MRPSEIEVGAIYEDDEGHRLAVFCFCQPPKRGMTAPHTWAAVYKPGGKENVFTTPIRTLARWATKKVQPPAKTEDA